MKAEQQLLMTEMKCSPLQQTEEENEESPKIKIQQPRPMKREINQATKITSTDLQLVLFLFLFRF